MDSQETTTPEVDSHLQENTLLRFRVGPFRFAVPAVEVEGIIVPPALTRIPLSPPHSKGVFMHHQRLASAISLRSKFGLADSENPDFGQLILGEVSVGLVAFWVDEVYETIDTVELEWRAMPQFIPHAAFESFAVKGDEVVLSTTMQQLYEVPAETAAQVLQGVRDSFELPQDIPPVASEALSSTGDSDAFGDLIPDQAAENGQADRLSIDSNGSANDTLTKYASPALPENPIEPEADATAQGTRSVSRPGTSHVVDFPGNQARHVTHGASRGNRIADNNRPQARSEAMQRAARTTAQLNQRSAIEGRRVTTENRSGDSSRERHQRGFVGGTHAGAVDRLSEYQYQGPDSQAYDDGRNEDELNQRPSRWWFWLLLALLLLALAAYVLWPTKKRDAVSTIPSQNYQSSYSFRESTPVPSVQEPRSSYEAVSPPPVARETTPVPTETHAEPAVIQNSESTATKGGDEIYRLEGQDVTLTVERSKPAKESSPVASDTKQPATSGQTNALIAGYDEFVHVVVKGDTLWDIAAKYLKNPFRYPELARLSEISNPDLIYPGDTVRIRARKK